MNVIYPNKLSPGDEVRIIAPSRSLKVVSEANRAIATDMLGKLNLKLTFGKHVDECDLMFSSSINSRVKDLHDAFKDPNVKAIMSVLGGYNSNQLLDAIDYKLIQQNPKIFCGFSDITALGNAIFHKTGLVTYSGVHYSSFGMQQGFEYSYDHFKKILFEDNPILLNPSSEWADDAWYLDQINRTFH
jgi:muramoyltetrapeptide carboxypeptidase